MKFETKNQLALTAALLSCFAVCLVGCQTPSDTVQTQVPESGQTERTKQVSFSVEVTFLDGTTRTYSYTTEEKTVGAALMAEGLILGEEGPYGLYVKTVGGETHDYDADGKYWAFYVDGEYAMAGVDMTDVREGAVYALRAE